MARCLLLNADLPSSLWAEAVNTAVYGGRKPNVSHLRIFGCNAFMLDRRPSKSKFKARATEYFLVGYSVESKAYRLYEPKSNKIFKSRDVRFLEQVNNILCKEVDLILQQETEKPKTSLLEEEKVKTLKFEADSPDVKRSVNVLDVNDDVFAANVVAANEDDSDDVPVAHEDEIENDDFEDANSMGNSPLSEHVRTDDSDRSVFYVSDDDVIADGVRNDGSSVVVGGEKVVEKNIPKENTRKWWLRSSKRRSSSANLLIKSNDFLVNPTTAEEALN
ncbi:uncharacterized protein LOC129943584 [Eupeodes corollae]|uniref:uncharacterized protein LOC129943584 n=1 Tax=Eupeodes corollae TaxID=290404 RepID=UPI0024921D73|nr:uncharacterized protein LOC129943584 [Eupeodes corollae]